MAIDPVCKNGRGARFEVVPYHHQTLIRIQKALAVER